MRKSLLKTTFLTLIFSLTATSAFAEPAGTVGFQFLRTHVGARASALAGAFVAIDNDINSLHYNPAGIGTVRKKSGSFTYLNDLLDFNTGYIGFVNPNVGPGNVGIGILYKDYGTFDGRDITGEETSEFGANAVSMAASYALELKQNLFVGASGKFIHYSVENYTSNAVALDAGVLYTIPSQSLNFGFAVYNVGQVTSAFVTDKDDLPFGMRFGATKKLRIYRLW